MWRIKKLKRTVNHVFAPLPFEYTWFKERNVSVDYVGHPFYDEVAEHQYDETFLKSHSDKENIVGILPGSRTREVLGNLNMFLAAAKKVEKQVPNTKFLVACFKEKHADYAKTLADQFPENIEICVGKTPEIMKVARCCMTVSGSVSLELLNHETPSVILYRIKPVDKILYRMLKQVDYITLVNLLSQHHRMENEDSPLTQDEIFPEYVTSAFDDSIKIADHISKWLTSEEAYQETQSQLHFLREEYAKPGACSRVAQLLLERLDAAPSSSILKNVA
jgi:lipid-A-disaccharide synthase